MEKIKIYFMARKISKYFSSGWERYSLSLFKALKKEKMKIILPSQKMGNLIKIKAFNSVSGPFFYDLLFMVPIVFRNGSDIYHATFPLQAIMFPLMRNKKTVVTFHDLSSLLFNYSSLKSYFSKFYKALAYKSAVTYSKHIITVSQQTKVELINILKVPINKITVIPLGVDEKFKKMNIEKNEIKIIGYIGALNKRKCVDFLIKAFYLFKKKYPEISCKLIICGTGPEYKHLYNLVRYLNVNDIEFRGFIPEKEIVAMYNMFDVFVFPSKHEGFGLPILEAQRCGVPTIVRKNAHIPYEVKKFAVQCLDINDLSNYIFKLLTNKDFYEEVREKGVTYSRQFTWSKCAKETIKIYEKVWNM